MTATDITTQAGPVDADHETIHRAYELVLGRAPESEQVYQDLLHRPLTFVLAAFFEGPEFAENVRRPVRRHTPPGGGFFEDAPREALLVWAAETLPLTAETRPRLRAATTWARLYDVLFDDPAFTEATNLTGGRPWTDVERRALAALARNDDGSQRTALIEEIDGGRVRGWAVDLAELDRPLNIEFWLEDVFLAATTADGFRRDVQDRFGGGGMAGFAQTLSGRTVSAGGRLEVRDSTTRRVLAAADWPQQALSIEPHESVRSELRHIRSVLERLEAAVPALASRQGFSLADYGDYHEAFYRAAPPVAGIAPSTDVGPEVVVDLTGADAGETEDLVWSLVDQMLPAAAVRLVGAKREAAEIEDLKRRIDWSGRLATPAAAWLTLHPDLGDAVRAGRSDAVVLIGAPGVVARDALWRFAEALAEPETMAVYGDEDRIGPESPVDRARHSDPRFKPAFDLDLLMQTPYVGDCVAIRREALAGLPSVTTPAEALLRLGAGGARVANVARVLWSARGEPRSENWTAVVGQVLAGTPGVEATPYVDEVGGAAAGITRVRRTVPNGVTASVIVPTRDRLDLLKPCVESLLSSAAHNRTAMELAIIDHESSEPETAAFLARVAEKDGVRVDRHEGSFNWALMNNLGADRSDADVLVFLNNDTVVLTPEWLDELVAQALRPEVGVVGARLLYEDSTLQHGGFVVRSRPEHYLSHDGVGLPVTDPGYLGRYGLVRRSVAVTGACLAIRRETFKALGGFDSARLAIEGNDVDLCLRAQAAGLAVIYNPHATIYHLESKSRGFARDGEALAVSARAGGVVWDRWAERGLGAADYNPHFDHQARPFSRLRPPTIGWPDLSARSE